MQSVVLDFETYYDTEFSLSKISFIEYIKSPLFEVISVSLKIGNQPTITVFGKDVAPLVKSIDWSDKAAVAHNGNEFDFPLLVWVYDVHPALFVDTLALSKARHQSEVGGSLAKLSVAYNLPVKDSTILTQTKGKRLADFTPYEIDRMALYNKIDTDNCYALYRTFRNADTEGLEDLREIVAASNQYKKELMLADMTARMIIYPQFVCDVELLSSTLAQAEAHKTKQLLEIAPLIGALDEEDVRAALSSAQKFAAILELLNVVPPTKVSPTTGKTTYAFAKTDEALNSLLEHEDERVQVVVAARLGVKSTLLETRLSKMKKCADLMGGWMPVPLAYHSATTGRWGGRIWNPQNLPRIPRDKQGNIVPKMTNALRLSLCAPEGHRIVVSDLSGIELRVNHYLWKVASTERLYANDPTADLYKEFAAAMYGIDKDAVSKDQRQLAKVAQLGLGFGAGKTTFQKVAKSMGGIDLDEDEADRVVRAWRTTYIAIVNGWRSCQQGVIEMYRGSRWAIDPRGLVVTDKNRLMLPSGRMLYYPDLHKTEDKGKAGFAYGTGRNTSKVYSGLLDENIVQAIARDVIAEQALIVRHRTGLSPALMVHDELVYVVPEDKAEQHLDTLNTVMRTPPAWLPGIVLWSEGDIALTYGEAK